jgi:hypothetical protein
VVPTVHPAGILTGELLCKTIKELTDSTEKLRELSEKYFPESGYAQKHEVPGFLKKNLFTRNNQIRS